MGREFDIFVHCGATYPLVASKKMHVTGVFFQPAVPTQRLLGTQKVLSTQSLSMFRNDSWDYKKLPLNQSETCRPSSAVGRLQVASGLLSKESESPFLFSRHRLLLVE